MPNLDISGLWLPDTVEFTDEEQQERQETRDKYHQIGQQVTALYQEDPTLTISQVVEKIEDAEYNDIVFILNEFSPREDGSVEYLGQGQGHGWIEESIRAGLVSTGDPEHIGFRWPDSSLREEPFDINNPDHRADQGIADQL